MSDPVSPLSDALTAPLAPSEDAGKPSAQGGASARALPLGSTLARRYRLGRLLARGGMAQVHEATQVDLVRRVAIKVVLPGLAVDAAGLRRFEREARFVASVQHPHVVAVHEFGRQDDGTAFIAMELVEGPTLREHLQQHEAGLPWREAVALAGQLCGALEATHEAGIVHGDVSAANVLLSPRSGRWCSKLIDFGAARRDGESVATQPTHATRPYAAPELHEGEPPTVRSDLYALGMLLEEMLGTRDGVPAALRRLLGEVLDASPQRRPQSAAQLALRLHQVLTGRPEQPDAWRAAAAMLGFLALGLGALGVARLGGARPEAASAIFAAAPVPATMSGPAGNRPDRTGMGVAAPILAQGATATPVAVAAALPAARQLSPEASLAQFELIAALDRWISDRNARVAKDRAPVMAIRVGKPRIAFDPSGNSASLTYRKRFSYAGPGDAKQSTIEERLFWAKVDGAWQLVNSRTGSRSAGSPLT